jgi:hypothetical protein
MPPPGYPYPPPPGRSFHPPTRRFPARRKPRRMKPPPININDSHYI